MKLSAVVQVIDHFTGAPLRSQPAFLLNQQRAYPFPKSSGFYAFACLPEGKFDLTVTSAEYFPVTFTLKTPFSMPVSEAIQICRMAPNPVYAYPDYIPVVRGLVSDKNNSKPVAHAEVTASYQTKRGKVKKQTTRTADFGNYRGRYALPITGQLAGQTEITVEVRSAGFATAEKETCYTGNNPLFLDIQLQSITSGE